MIDGLHHTHVAGDKLSFSALQALAYGTPLRLVVCGGPKI
jgi:hypothetical protein